MMQKIFQWIVVIFLFYIGFSEQRRSSFYYAYYHPIFAKTLIIFSVVSSTSQFSWLHFTFLLFIVFLINQKLMILFRIVILVCISHICHSQLQDLQKQTQNWFLSNLFLKETEQQKQYKRQFQQKMSCISFQDVIEIYPFVKENMDQFRLAHLLLAKGCKHIVEPVIFLVLDNEIYKFGSYQGHYRMNLLERILNQTKQKRPLPNIYFTIHLEDQMANTSFPIQSRQICYKTPLVMYNKDCFSTYQKSKFLIPDPYISQKNFAQFLTEFYQQKKKIKWQDKKQKFYFRGNPTTPSSTPNYVVIQFNQKFSEEDLYRLFHRGVFAILSVKYPDLIDAKLTAKNSFSQQIKKRLQDDESIYSPHQSFKQALKYKYLLSADGYGASWMRIPFILHSNSLLFKIKSKKIQYFYDKMIPGVHYIEVNDDLSNLFTKMDEMNKNSEKAKQIIANANQFANKYLSPEYILYKIIQTFEKYSKIQKISLSQLEKNKLKSGIHINQILVQRYSRQLKNCQNFIIGQIVIFLIFSVIKFAKKCFKRKIQQNIVIENTEYANLQKTQS